MISFSINPMLIYLYLSKPSLRFSFQGRSGLQR